MQEPQPRKRKEPGTGRKKTFSRRFEYTIEFLENFMENALQSSGRKYEPAMALLDDHIESNLQAWLRFQQDPENRKACLYHWLFDIGIRMHNKDKRKGKLSNKKRAAQSRGHGKQGKSRRQGMKKFIAWETGAFGTMWKELSGRQIRLFKKQELEASNGHLQNVQMLDWLEKKVPDSEDDFVKEYVKCEHFQKKWMEIWG